MLAAAMAILMFAITAPTASAANSIYPVRSWHPGQAWTMDSDVRSKSGLTAWSIDALLGQTTQFQHLGAAFMAAERTSGINARVLIGIAVLESNYGKSDLAIHKNNLFGFNANDRNPYGDATAFARQADGVAAVAAALAQNYTTPSGAFYTAPTLRGINVRYASAKHWAKSITWAINSMTFPTLASRGVAIGAPIIATDLTADSDVTVRLPFGQRGSWPAGLKVHYDWILISQTKISGDPLSSAPPVPVTTPTPTATPSASAGVSGTLGPLIGAGSSLSVASAISDASPGPDDGIAAASEQVSRATIADLVAQAPGQASAASMPSASPAPSASPIPSLVPASPPVPQSISGVVHPSSSGAGIAMTLHAPSAPGHYHLTITVLDTDGHPLPSADGAAPRSLDIMVWGMVAARLTTPPNAEVVSGSPFTIPVAIHNTGVQDWGSPRLADITTILPAGQTNGVQVVAQWLDSNGAKTVAGIAPAVLNHGQTMTVIVSLTAPAVSGVYRLSVGLTGPGGSFADVGLVASPVSVKVVMPPVVPASNRNVN
jgi:hypothetical protein